MEAERETGCFRCGYQWPEWCIQRENLPTFEEAIPDMVVTDDCYLCGGTINPGIAHCKRCASWLYSGLSLDS